MRLDRGSDLAREEHKEKKKLRNSSTDFMQDLLNDQMKERK